MSRKTFIRPGVAVSIFLSAPPDANAIQLDDSSSKDADPLKLPESIVSLWSSTGCTGIASKFMEAIDENRIKWLPKLQVVNVQSLKELLEETGAGDSLLAVAGGNGAKTHESILQRHDDAISLRCNWCPEDADDDLSTAADWAGPLIAKAQTSPIFGMTRIYYFEFQDKDGSNHNQEFDSFVDALRSQLKLSNHESNTAKLSDGSLLSRIQAPQNTGDLGGLHDIFVAGIASNQQAIDEFIARFHLSDDYHRVPAGALYPLAFQKISVHHLEAIQANVSARRIGKSIADRLNRTSKKVKPSKLDDCQTELANTAGELEALDTQLFLVREAQTTIRLNLALVADRASKAFRVDVSQIHDDSIYTFIREDLDNAQHAELQVGGFADYLSLMTTRFTSRVNFIRTQLESLFLQGQRTQLEAQERLTERFHLLEIFIVTVYALELPHIYETMKGRGLVLAALSAIIVLLFIFGLPRLRKKQNQHSHTSFHESKQGWSLRTVIACAMLIFLPFLWSSETFKKGWSNLVNGMTGSGMKEIESGSVPKDHSH